MCGTLTHRLVGGISVFERLREASGASTCSCSERTGCLRLRFALELLRRERGSLSTLHGGRWFTLPPFCLPRGRRVAVRRSIRVFTGYVERPAHSICTTSTAACLVQRSATQFRIYLQNSIPTASCPFRWFFVFSVPFERGWQHPRQHPRRHQDRHQHRQRHPLQHHRHHRHHGARSRERLVLRYCALSPLYVPFWMRHVVLDTSYLMLGARTLT